MRQPRVWPLGGRAPAPSANGEALVALRHPRSPASEAYRLLRTNLHFAGLGSRVRVLLVTSPGAAEGKSTTVANLGVTLAQAGRRVVVVDADLRRPRMHGLFGVTAARGLTHLLVGEDCVEAALEGTVRPTALPGLSVLPCGPIPPNPAELLGGARCDQVLAALRERFDLVLVDSPPVLAVTDALLLARRADGVVMVLRQGETPRAAAREAREALERAGGRVLGAVLNGVRPEGGEYRYYYHYYYGRGGGDAVPATGEGGQPGPAGV